ncbi:glycosyltransferase family 4 protein [Arthrobacter bussei]|uniref:Glycosyltransferase family 4 protein n=1 Tax=Arthrobacter bussei TaxID=2594179 RepID=A0A7X1NRQ1_9MICC|nr:glycosyltransferase family 4 protein [Arthrobacter bussei]MPY11674.1 glycosyltransferase family 4 protein [Arthrobacter bussei]
MIRRDDVGQTRTVLIAHPSADLYGSDRVLLETIAGLTAAGLHVVLTVPHHGPLVPEAEQRGATVRLCPTPVLRKAFLSPSGLIRLAGESLASLLASVRLVRETRPVGVYVNTITIPLWSFVASLTRTPLLVHIHEAEGTASTVVRKLLASPLFLADSLITNSRFSVDVLASSFPRLARKCRVVANGVAGPPSVDAARPDISGPVRLVYVGRLSHRKGPDLVIESLADLRSRDIDADLQVVGAVFPGNEVYEADLRRRIDELGVGDRVHLQGFQPSVWPFIAQSDIVVVPSRVDEPFGNTAVEAMLAARPAVVSDTSGLREASAGFGSVLRVSPDSAAGIADAVADMVASWATYREAALADSGVAESRNGIAAYRAEIVREVEALSRGRKP